MSFDKSLSSMPEERIMRLGLTGNTTSDPTVRAGRGMTVTRTAIGILKIAFNDNPGTFVGLAGEPVFRAATASGVKGYTANAVTYTAPASGADGYISVYLWDASQAAVDLTTTQYLDLAFVFTAQSKLT